jgi:hypothetical protein
MNAVLIRRRSRCKSAAPVAGKRCAPGRGDLGHCPTASPALSLPRRMNQTLRAVCRLWWRGPGRPVTNQPMHGQLNNQ